MRTRPVPVITPAKVAPLCITLPEPGERCWWTGMSRDRLMALIVPCEENDFKPPVRSIVHASNRGVVRLRLIHFQSLVDYIDGQAMNATI